MRILFVMATIGVIATPAAAASYVNYEAPGVQNTTAGFTTVGVETFDSRAAGSPAGFTTDFGTGGAIQATYSGGRIDTANQYGSAGGTGNHIVTFSNLNPITIEFTTTLPEGLTYFGYWLSALNAGNTLQFYSAGNLVATIDTGSVKGEIDSRANAAAYYGNPNAPYAGNNSGEPYAFLNIYFTDGDSYDKIVISQLSSGGYESDNHTVGFYTRVGGVPEPTTWAMLIAGFGLVGAAARRRRTMAPRTVA
ncbi:PEPxxWA-CTERM sorting domain-containing protein [Sandaracinobacter sp. RS1-74]|uniref:Npun_F0296 family exosortase-dependent surface protein n=1 Tax=Sandaracinobacteroides sayramensis TaxID=2913411 RepID=UPI001EDBA81D|nr:PEPxxWA-CTERM sorting domain-containing protein [Sandaracinobacteroides sayramensis]MCG2842722.1 PEPxxWA-CTERM sorting domain-containing protein [Sandaracinobacteroides sayramensis]